MFAVSAGSEVTLAQKNGATLGVNQNASGTKCLLFIQHPVPFFPAFESSSSLE